jgi:cytochrome P450 monooxygenase
MDRLLSKDGKSFALLVPTVLLALALAVLYPTWHRHRQMQALRSQRGCQEPARYPHQDRALGSDLARIRTEAMKEGRLFKLYDSHFDLYGKTFEENARGHRLINTIEPANIQQITSTAVGDYGKDPGRTKAQAPFLGPSIFSDGLIWKQARALLTPTFKRAEISDIDQLARFADSFLDLIPGDDSEINMQPLLHRLVSDFPKFPGIT